MSRQTFILKETETRLQTRKLFLLLTAAFKTHATNLLSNAVIGKLPLTDIAFLSGHSN